MHELCLRTDGLVTASGAAGQAALQSTLVLMRRACCTGTPVSEVDGRHDAE